MKYTEFRDVIQNSLQEDPEGKTWKELRDLLSLPCKTPCPEWIKRLENGIGLYRTARRGKALVWRIN